MYSPYSLVGFTEICFSASRRRFKVFHFFFSLLSFFFI